jgi:hypothetical protein
MCSFGQEDIPIPHKTWFVHGNGNANPPVDRRVRVESAILFDDYPEEAGIVVTDDRESNVVVNYPPGSFSSPGLFTETVDLLPGDYKINITDSFGDGLCCEFGEGRFEVHALSFPDDEVVLLAEGDGRFTNSIVVAFTVPSPQETEPPVTTDPPGPPTARCRDQNETAFLVEDSGVGDANCAWLGVNCVRYNYLCQFLDVAATCRQTCDACEFSSNFVG